MSEVTEEEIVQIVQSFLLNSPPGEFVEVVTDVRGLLKNDALLNRIAPATFREYNTEQMLIVQNGQNKTLVTKYGEVGSGQYVDPAQKTIFNFDHIRQEVTGQAGAANMDSSAEPFRAAFEAAAREYQEEHFDQGACAVYGSKGADGNPQVTICISATVFNPSNFYNGRWRSVWTVSIANGKAQLNGNIRINVHYYEDGNVQLNTNTNKATSVDGGDPNALAQAALKQIAAIEGKFQAAMQESYRTMGDTTFKALRRALPITRKQIEWTKIMHHHVAGELGK